MFFVKYWKFTWNPAEDISESSIYNVKKVIKRVINIDKKSMKSNTLNGVYATISELIGFENAVKLYENFRGNQVNFPQKLFSKEFVLQEAIKSYDGTSDSINKIATKFNYSERTIRNWMKLQ